MTTGSQWEALLIQAYRIIDHVNLDHPILTSWTFGGGTALMLQIDHRAIHDIDLFLTDPQLLPYVTAAVSDLSFEIGDPVYAGDGIGHLKVAFDKIGEIDFIVAGHVTHGDNRPDHFCAIHICIPTPLAQAQVC